MLVCSDIVEALAPRLPWMEQRGAFTAREEDAFNFLKLIHYFHYIGALARHIYSYNASSEVSHIFTFQKVAHIAP